jgi:hypothetical protein
MNDLTEAILRPVLESVFRVLGDSVNGWVLGGQIEAAKMENGRFIARYCRRMIGCCAVGAAVFAVPAIICLAERGYARWISVPFILAALACLYSLLDCTCTRFEFNRDELVVKTLWRGRRLVPSSAVEALGYSIWGNRVIYAGVYGNISVGQYLSGIKTLTDLVRAKLAERQTPSRTGGEK